MPDRDKVFMLKLCKELNITKATMYGVKNLRVCSLCNILPDFDILKCANRGWCVYLLRIITEYLYCLSFELYVSN